MRLNTLQHEGQCSAERDYVRVISVCSARRPHLYVFMMSVQWKIYVTSGSRCDETAHLVQMGFTHQRTEMNNREKFERK